MLDRASFMTLLDDMFERNWYTNMGPLVGRFEEALRAHVGATEIVAVNNATSGLSLVAQALGLHGEVIVPAFTFVATAHALRWQGIQPVFADVDRGAHTLSPESVEALITPRTTGVVGVHTWGEVCDVQALHAICERRGIALIFDAAHALGSTDKGEPVGGFGDAEVFSFHATKFVQSFEGGAITTKDPALAERLRKMSNFGFSGTDIVTQLGINAKMTEVCAAMGISNLACIQQLYEVNARNWALYCNAFANLPGFSAFNFAPGETRNLQYVVFEVDGDTSTLSRDELVTVLRAEGCLARRYFYPGVHRMEPYLTESPTDERQLPATESLVNSVLILPTGPSIGASEIEKIADIVRVASQHADEVRRVLVGKT